jgi:calcineurin-like phosphoesterase family protein
MTIWITSDTHFGHARMVTDFKLADGSPARNFESVEEMDETMIERWNEVVRPQDKIYHLGDVAMRQQDIDRVMPRLNGHKRLVRGNHDIFRTKLYARYFEEIMGMRVLNHLIFTHVPIAPWSQGSQHANVHGHVHQNLPRLYEVPRGLKDPEGGGPPAVYVNVCTEMTDYRPVTLEEISGWVKQWRER